MYINKEIISRMEENRQHQAYRIERILLDFVAEINARMETLGVNRADLAKRLGASRAFVSKIMKCNHNITLKTMDSISYALGMELGVNVQEMKSIEEELATNCRFIYNSMTETAHKAFNNSWEIHVLSGAPMNNPANPLRTAYISSNKEEKKEERISKYDDGTTAQAA